MPFQPFLIDKKRIDKQLNVWEWNPSCRSSSRSIPRDDLHGEIRWIKTDLPPQYMMHTMSANVVGDELQLDGPIFNRPPFPFEQDFADGDDIALFFSIAKSFLGRWTIDLRDGMRRSPSSSRTGPRSCRRSTSATTARATSGAIRSAASIKRCGMKMNSLVVTNMKTMAEQVHQIRTDEPAAVLEATFAPRSVDSPEGDGYIIVPVSWWAREAR